MSVVWVTRFLALVFGVVTWFALRYPEVWDKACLIAQWVWYYLRHVIVAMIVTYVSHFLMMKLWQARPDVYHMVESGIDNSIVYMSGKLWDVFTACLELFGHKALDYFLYGFNVTTKPDDVLLA